MFCKLNFCQLPFSEFILGEMIRPPRTRSPKFFDLISYAHRTARVRVGTWIKTKQCFVSCVGLFLVAIFYILKSHMKRARDVCLSKWPGASGDYQGHQIGVWFVAPELISPGSMLETQTLGNPDPWTQKREPELRVQLCTVRVVLGLGPNPWGHFCNWVEAGGIKRQGPWHGPGRVQECPKDKSTEGPWGGARSASLCGGPKGAGSAPSRAFPRGYSPETLQEGHMA